MNNQDNNFYYTQDISYPPHGRGNWEPNLSGTGLLPAHIPATDAHYIQMGELVFIYANFDLVNVTDFGTGNYTINLPFEAAYHAEMFGGTVHDNNHTFYTVKLHIEKDETECGLYSIAGGAHDEPISHNVPINFTTSDKIHIAGWYERKAY